MGYESSENLVTRRAGPDVSSFRDPNTAYAAGGLQTPTMPTHQYLDEGGAWGGSEWDKKDPSMGGGSAPAYSSAKEADGLVVKEAPNVVKEVPSTRIRRWWLWTMWAYTWVIPLFCSVPLGG
ncbi:hypothetical protein VKT23_019307 [Stygiomarasmius scandens]|uniref:Uncharacterized protein n=1 Tax=Marasmiellus scandens TaxID=2682957 RepID=A0ABR1ILP8_9AGAR